MGIILGDNQYGKAENRVVRIYRDSPRHEIKDINVGTCLRGDFAAAHTDGDQRTVLPTDSQKQTAYAYAKEVGIESIEKYALALAYRFVNHTEPVVGARIEVEEYSWERAVVNGAEHDHTWVRKGQEIRTADITVEGTGEDQKTWVIGGLKDLVVLKSTGSEFHDFLTDEYTVLEPTDDRVMSTSLVAKWRFMPRHGAGHEAEGGAGHEAEGGAGAGAGAGGYDHVDWETVYPAIKQIIIEKFATVHSLALQQTLYEIGKAILEAFDDIAEVRLSAPNIHHFVYDLSRFGLENNNEVFNADDRPYGLIQATIARDDAPDAGPSWTPQRAWLA